MAGEDHSALAVLGEERGSLRVAEQGIAHPDLVGERLDVVEDLLFVRERIARDLDEIREHVHHLALHLGPDPPIRAIPSGVTVAVDPRTSGV